jgi:ParB-like chromosome segregation protein Spo0J
MKHNGITLHPSAKPFKKTPPIPENSRLKSIASGTAEVFKLDPRLIEREPGFNPRYDFGEILLLAEDILENGVLEALKVRKEGTRVFLVNGDRRLTAVELLIKNQQWPADPKNPGYPMPIPCTSEGQGVKPIDRLFMMLSLNTGKPFTLLEKGLAYQQILATDPDMTASEIARRSGETKQAVSNALQIVQHASPTLIGHIKDGSLSATTALDIIKSTDGHDEQDTAAAAALATASEHGRSHATPKDLPAKTPKKTPQKQSVPPVISWDYRFSEDHRWTDNTALAPTKLRVLGTLKHGIAILELMSGREADGQWRAGYNLQTELVSTSALPVLADTNHPDEASAFIAAWKSLGPTLGTFARESADPLATLEYLAALGTELTCAFPTGWDHDNAIFADPDTAGEGTTDPTASAYFANLSDDDEDNDDEDSHSPDPSLTPSSSPADPSAYERLKNAPSSNRDGTSGGPGEGFATPDKRLKNIEKALDELDPDECHRDRWNTVEMVMDYLNGNHTIKTLKDHLKQQAPAVA